MTKQEMEKKLEELTVLNQELQKQLEPEEVTVAKVAVQDRAKEVAQKMKAQAAHGAGKAINITGRAVRGIRHFVTENWK